LSPLGTGVIAGSCLRAHKTSRRCSLRRNLRCRTFRCFPFLNRAVLSRNACPCRLTHPLKRCDQGCLMLRWHRTIAFLLTASSCLSAQLTVENPKKLDVSEAQIQTMFLNITRVMEAEFHSPGALALSFRVRLVLGETPERFTIDDPYGNGTIYMERWNEGKFAVSTMRLAVQHLLGPERQKKMLEEVVRRTRENAPVAAGQLRKQGVSPPLLGSDFPPADPCQAGPGDIGLRGTPCAAVHPGPMRR